MSSVLIINPILYTSETNKIPRTDSIKDTMIYALCMGFVRNGHNVTLIAAQDYAPARKESYPFEVIFMRTVWHRIFMPRCFPYMPGLRSYLRRHREYDMVIASEIFAPWSYTAARVCPDKTIVWHELAAHNNMLHRIPSVIWYNTVARCLMRKVRVVPRSEAAAAFVRQFMRRVSDTVIDHGVNLEKLDTIFGREGTQETGAKTVLPEKKKQFAVVSQLIGRKRIDRIIEVFAEFVQKGYEEYKLYIIGSGEKEEQLRMLVQEKQLQDQIVFCGQMTHAQLLPVVAGSEALLVYTSKDNNMVSIVESIAVGTPVVTTSVPYNAAYIRREQLGIAEDDWTEEALIKIVEDNGLYRQNCLRYRRKLSNTFCAERFMDVRASSEGS